MSHTEGESIFPDHHTNSVATRSRSEPSFHVLSTVLRCPNLPTSPHHTKHSLGLAILVKNLLVPQDGTQEGNDDVAVVVGRPVPAPRSDAFYAVAAPSTPAANTSIPVATARPSSSSSSSAYTAPVMHNSTGTWTVPGSTTSGGRHGGGVSGGTSSSSSSSMRGSSGSWGAGGSGGGGGGGGGGGSGGGGGGAAGADGAIFPVMTHTGTRNVPGCGTASSTGGRRFGEEGAGGAGGGGKLGRSGSGKGAA